ncbi:c-type cytochrome [Sulfuricystis multivorans]|uniref:c-type cytochrome n=1 Tax=Sulfuricystis multivorans TaxID=2211108 RepID=UPI000F826945|nr:c-type cytochrome [Sulfuricystis multivorans]
MDDHEGRPGRTARQAAIRSGLLALLAGMALACSAAAEDRLSSARRLGAELLILDGDVRELIAGRAGALERDGLVLRLQGALSSLPLTLRRAGGNPQSASALRSHLERRDWQAFKATLAPLIRRYPFTAPFLTLPVTPQRIAAGKTLHKETCAACHDADWGDTLLPAKNLAALAARLPRAEFAARLWLGVRGTREHAYANPFSDEELANLLAYYEKARP